MSDTGNLKVVNIIVTGRMPFKRHIREQEVERLMLKSGLKWMVLNEEINPIITYSTPSGGCKRSGEPRMACVSIWYSGAINIVGVTKMSDARKLYHNTVREIRKFIPGVFR